MKRSFPLTSLLFALFAAASGMTLAAEPATAEATAAVEAPAAAEVASDAVPATDAPAAAPDTRALDEEIQAIKKDVVDLNRDLFVLEEELLFPANTQVAVFLSMDVGEFPAEGEDTVVPLSWAQAAIGRIVEVGGLNFLGIDVARHGGNESVMASMKGRRVALERTYRGKDLVWTANTAMELAARDRYRAIGVDDAGLGGGVTDQLKAKSLPVVPIIGGGREGMRQPNRYANLNAEMWFSLRAELDAGFNDLANPEVGLSLPNDKRLINQLVSARYGYDDLNRRKLEKKKLKKTAATEEGDSDSPDRADAVVIANWMRAGQHTSQGQQVHRALLDSVNEGHDRGGLAASLIRDIS